MYAQLYSGLDFDLAIKTYGCPLICIIPLQLRLDIFLQHGLSLVFNGDFNKLYL